MENLVSQSLKRVGVYLFFDERGVVDDYVVYMLSALREHTDRVIVVCNGAPNEEGLEKFRSSGVEVMVRDNSGFDVYAYKECIESIGRSGMEEYDELLLMNYTFYGPLFPLSEMFGKMDSTECDFWGITAHAESGSPFDAGLRMPFHIQSHFIAVRGQMLNSDAFWNYWEAMPPINSYQDSILQHESRFTGHFSDLGYVPSVYMNPTEFSSQHPIFVEVDLTIQKRCPIIKRRVFFHDPLYLEAEAIDLHRAIDLIRTYTDYPLDLIWKNIVYAAEPRTLYTNVEMLEILPPVRIGTTAPSWKEWKVAVIAHIFYPDMADEIGEELLSIPLPFDLYVTTDTEAKRERLVQAFSRHAGVRRLEVRVMESNAGRETSAMLIGCRDVVLDGEYELICKLHAKKSPQDGAARGRLFKRHCIENLVGTRGYVENLFDLAARERSIGVLMPPVMQIGYPTLGHGWFYNREKAKAIAEELGLRVKFDQHTPLAPLGAMYWFRPKALRPLFLKRWKWSDFDSASYGDGDLPHAIERLITYCAQSQGFLTWCIMTTQLAAKNYVKIEYKYQILASCFSTGDPRGQVATMLQRMDQDKAPTVAQAVRVLYAAMRRSIKFRIQRVVRGE